MKKNGITFFLLAIIVLSIVIVACRTGKTETEYLRIHVRANSSLQQDQDVKYIIKDDLVSYLTPFIAEVKSKSEAISLLNSKTTQMEAICNNRLKSRGLTYSASVSIVEEYFPTRVYDDVTLEAGYYDAIIVSLGEAKGDNWWCVVYPPLCFVKNAPVKYKSKLLEIIKKFNV